MPLVIILCSLYSEFEEEPVLDLTHQLFFFSMQIHDTISLISLSQKLQKYQENKEKKDVNACAQVQLTLLYMSMLLDLYILPWRLHIVVL